MIRRSITMPINRVEGDLEINVDIADHRVVKAQVIGTMFRGFEQMMQGRGLLDGLVVTPRICGICSTSHLYAAALALDDLHKAQVPDNAVRMRNLTHIAEHLQSDLRHAILMFAVDFAHESYKLRGFHEEAVRRYRPLKGTSAISTVKATRLVLEIVAIIGGQWPHSSFMVPGGIVSTPSRADLRKCRMILEEFKSWYEQQILGGPLVEWQQVKTCADLTGWCTDPAHAAGDLPQIVRISEELGLDCGDVAHGFISGGSLPLPKSDMEPGTTHLFAPGHWHEGKYQSFETDKISEQLASSFYREVQGMSGSLYREKTTPDIDKSQAYSWVKSPRYARQPVETSPLGELLCARHKLLGNLVNAKGTSPLVRELARLIRPAELLPAALRWLQQTDPQMGYYCVPKSKVTGRGLGIVQASRGMLGHWLEVIDEKISNYQMITPTSWNASPRDDRGQSGPMEQALLGAQVADPENPMELGHIVRSFDPCLVCAVHSLHKGEKRVLRLGATP